jgi:NifU-like protein involved in Fe-S cluster formation
MLAAYLRYIIVMPYSAILLDHLMNPRQVGELPAPTYVFEAINPACGDRIKLFINCLDGQITEVRMQAYGCPPTLAAASFLAELLPEKSLISLSAITPETIVLGLGGLPRGKLHAADLAVEVVQQLLTAHFCST